jgi:hypothetical protein
MQRITQNLCRLLGIAALGAGIAAAATIYPPGTYFTLAPDSESYDGKAIPTGGTNPTPIDATLTGTFSPTSISIGGPGMISILPTFSTTISDSPSLVDGDSAVIYATNASSPGTTYAVAVLSWDLIFPGNAGEFDILNLSGPNSLPPDFPITTLVNLGSLTLTVDFPGTGTAPEPGTWMLLLTGLVAVVIARGKFMRSLPRSFFRIGGSAVAKCLIAVVSLYAAQSAFGQIHLATETVPSSGVAGVTNVSVLGSGFPSTATADAPTHIVVSLSSTCGGAPVAASTGTNIRLILGSTDRVNFNIPGGIATGLYFVTIADSTAGDADFTTTSGSCAALQVTGSTAILNACVAGSSMGVLLPNGGAKGNVTAYVPKAWWGGTATGIFVQNIEGTIGSTSTIATPNAVNSCSSNPATGQSVCVANNTDVYLVTGTALNSTVKSSSTSRASFSGGTCNNCGVAINAANNTAAINGGFAGGASGDGIQILNLGTSPPSFNAPLGMNQIVSENISVDPTRSLILSANESGYYPIVQIQADGSLKEFNSTFNSGAENDSSAEDCSTGVAIAPGEFTNQVQLVNLNNITFGTTTYTAPNSTTSLVTAYSFSAGLSGSAVAQGSGHLAVVTGEFGGNTFAVLKLPAVPSTTTPSILDYVVAAVPGSTACGGAFVAGFDPHTITAYTSPNTGDAYAVFAGYIGGVPGCLAVVDMTTLINTATRGGAGFQAHDISAANLPASAVTFFPL